MTCKNGLNIEFRFLDKEDAKPLGDFFESLSSETKNKYGPHPLTTEFAHELCNKLNHSKTTRLIATDKNKVIGYFILDFGEVKHEIDRYASFGIELKPARDPLFAPCISDQYQNTGISSLVMPKIIDYLKSRESKSLVLLGGTQETNTLGINFYKKWGFEECGSYMTEINNLDMRLVF